MDGRGSSRIESSKLGPRLLGLTAILAILIGSALYRYVWRAGARDKVAQTSERETLEPEPAEAPEEQRFQRRVFLPPSGTAEATESRNPDNEPPRSPVNAREHRDKSVAEIKESGPDRRKLITSANRVGTAWAQKAVKVGVDAQFGQFECHQKGCFMTVVHKSEDEVTLGMEAITRTGEFHGWQSGKMRSGPIERPDGKVEVTWFLFPPEGGKEPLLATLPEDNLDELLRRQEGNP